MTNRENDSFRETKENFFGLIDIFGTKKKMDKVILLRNRSARSIRNVLSYANNDDFGNQTVIGLKNRLGHLNKHWKRFVVRNTKLIEQTRSKREKKEHWKLYDEIETDYLCAKEIINSRINELKNCA